MNNLRTACLKFAGPLALALAAVALPAAGSSAQTARAPQPSTGGKILFQSTQGSDTFVNEIYTMDGDGKRQTRLTYNEFDDTTPVWSPDGSKVAFLSERGAGYDIYLMNADGTGEHALRDAAHGGPLNTVNLQWSPDGTKIIYSDGGKIYVVEAVAPGGGDSTAPVQNLSASAPSYAYDVNPAWSPDGSQIAFVTYGCLSCSTPDLFTMNADGTGRTQLTTTSEAEYDPVWSPMGGSIAYGSLRGGGRNVYVINANGTGDHLLTAGVSDADSHAWSPDGSRVAFNSTGPVGIPRRGVYAINADGTGLTFLAEQGDTSYPILWSPDGTRLVTHISNDTNSIDVIAFAADGSSRHATNLTKTKKADEFAYSWR